MDFETFRKHFRAAAIATRDFARKYIEEPLPDAMVFRPRLNCSYDGNPLLGDERIYPQDSSFERIKSLSECSEDLVLSTLWRDGAIPEWVNLSVIGETGEETIIELEACGRFTARDDFLYHQHEGKPPFHVLGPVIPARYSISGHSDSILRFSIYDRSQCWSEKDVKRVAQNNYKVWSLELLGEEFDDDSLNNLPDFSGLEILELRASPINGSGLRHLDRYSKLRVLRIWLEKELPFSLKYLPTLPNLTDLGLEGISSFPIEVDVLGEKLASLSSMTLRAIKELVVNGEIPQANFCSEFASLTLIASRVTGNLLLPEELRSLNLHLFESNSQDVEKLLKPVKGIKNLGLRDTPLDEATAFRLIEHFQLEYIDLVGTGLEKESILRIASRYPHVRMYPNYRS